MRNLHGTGRELAEIPLVHAQAHASRSLHDFSIGLGSVHAGVECAYTHTSSRCRRPCITAVMWTEGPKHHGNRRPPAQVESGWRLWRRWPGRRRRVGCVAAAGTPLLAVPVLGGGDAIDDTSVRFLLRWLSRRGSRWSG